LFLPSIADIISGQCGPVITEQAELAVLGLI
jgi:hypothetical protein